MNCIKKTSKIISLIIVLSMLLSNITAFAAERVITASGTYWTLYDDGELCVSGGQRLSSSPWKDYYKDIKKITIAKDVTVNESFDFYFNNASGYPNLETVSVEEGNGAFYADEKGVLYSRNKSKLYLFPNASGITEYEIPDSVTRIMGGAFCGNKTLSILSGGKNLETIDTQAFYFASALKSVPLPEGLVSIGNYAFYQCDSLESITIPDSVTKLGSYSFSGCSSAETLVIGIGVTDVPTNAFANCSSLETVILSASAVNFSNYAFNNCTNIRNLYFNGTESDWCRTTTSTSNSSPLYFTENFYIGGKLVTDFVVPLGVETIPARLFHGYKKLKSVTFSDTVTTINNSSFRGCSNLESVAISDSVTVIENFAFENCTKLSDIRNSQNLESLGIDVFENTAYCSDPANWDNGFLYLGNCLLEVDKDKISSDCKLYSKTRLIAKNAFMSCDKLKSVTLNSGVKHISSGAFHDCQNLESVFLPEGLKTISEQTFSYCSSLQEIKIPESVETIGGGAFSYTALTSLEIPGNVKILSPTLVAQCENFEEFILNEGLEEICENAFITCHFSSISIPSTVKKIEYNAFFASEITDIYYGNTKAEWKRATNGKGVDGITVHYTLKNDDESVIIQHTDSNFDYEAGNIHLDVFEPTAINIKTYRNGFYLRNQLNPIKLLNIKIVDGDGNSIQPLSGEYITLKIKAPEEFKETVLSIIGVEGEIDFETVEYANGIFTYELNGKKETVLLPEEKGEEFRVVHWFTDSVDFGDYESFRADRLVVLDGYIILETNHFSEYAVCTEYVPEYTITFDTDGGTEIAPITLEYGEAITPPANPEKEGYTFIGWSPEIPETMPANDITVVAQYEKNEEPADPDAPTAKVTGIKVINLPNKTQYSYKDKSLDLSGIALKVMYSDGKSEIITDTDMLKAYGFNASSVGTKTITVSYGGYTDEFEITVSYTWWQMIIRILFLGFLWY